MILHFLHLTKTSINPFQTYLSDYDDDGAYGHVALGRSFALELGSLIPQSDRKLGRFVVLMIFDTG